MSAKILESDGKPMFAVIPYDEYRALADLAEDAGDVAALARYAKRYAQGREESFPAEVVDRLLAGESPLRVWREHRGMTAAALAQSVGVTAAHVSRIESGKCEPSVGVLRRFAKVLNVGLDLLVGPE